jgi:hypothetical protein
VRGFLKEHGQEYRHFLLIQIAHLPLICSKCQNKSFTPLWLTDPRNPIDGRLWAKFYFWCEQCHTGIYCPLGTWRIPRTTPHIGYRDEEALKAALPPDLKLIKSPRASTNYLASRRFAHQTHAVPITNGPPLKMRVVSGPGGLDHRGERVFLPFHARVKKNVSYRPKEEAKIHPFGLILLGFVHSSIFSQQYRLVWPSPHLIPVPFRKQAFQAF